MRESVRLPDRGRPFVPEGREIPVGLHPPFTAPAWFPPAEISSVGAALKTCPRQVFFTLRRSKENRWDGQASRLFVNAGVVRIGPAGIGSSVDPASYPGSRRTAFPHNNPGRIDGGTKPDLICFPFTISRCGAPSISVTSVPLVPPSARYALPRWLLPVSYVSVKADSISARDICRSRPRVCPLHFRRDTRSLSSLRRACGKGESPHWLPGR